MLVDALEVYQLSVHAGVFKFFMAKDLLDILDVICSVVSHYGLRARIQPTLKYNRGPICAQQ